MQSGTPVGNNYLFDGADLKKKYTKNQFFIVVKVPLARKYDSCDKKSDTSLPTYQDVIFCKIF